MEDTTPSNPVEAYPQDLARALLTKLQSLSFEAFEQVMCSVIAAAGYSRPRILTRKYPKGMHRGGSGDLSALLSVGTTHVPVLVLVKQFKRPVQKRFVHELRGSMLGRRITNGLIVTTSTFPKGTIEAAAWVTDSPITLIDGPTVAKLLIHHRIGVVEQWTPQLAIDDAYFANLEQPR